MNREWPSDATMLQHLAEEEHAFGAVVPPVVQTSTFVFESVGDFVSAKPDPDPHYIYSRINNPTVRVLEQKVAALERAEAARVFSSGMAAISAAVLSCVRSGEHVVCVETAYGPTRKFLQYLQKFDITHTLVDGREVDEVLAAFDPGGRRTSLLYLESPSSLLFRLQDLGALATECRERGVSTICDNTYGLTRQHPIQLGIDITVHSASKVIGGHSDVVAGAMATSRERMDGVMNAELELLGSIVSPFNAWLLLRGLRTLPMRLDRSRAAADLIAPWLAERPEVAEVFHVGLKGFAQAALRDRQMSAPFGLFSFRPRTQDRGKVTRFVEALRLFQIGVSWGGHESLVVPVLPHPSDWESEQLVVRLYCGFEDPLDLRDDLLAALPLLA